MNNKIIYSIGLLILTGFVFFGIYTQRSVQKGASTEISKTAVSDVSVTPTNIPSAASTSISTIAGLSLTITSPSNGQTFTTNQVTVKGKTSPNAEVFVNDEELTADASGNFSQALTLEEGENYILVVANDADGNFAEKEISVTYTPS